MSPERAKELVEKAKKSNWTLNIVSFIISCFLVLCLFAKFIELVA